MATAEAETSRDEQVPPRGLVYDGFISYSHAADDLLAPRLQAGLQRFAKPWWKRRAVRIFRDESSLSANPHLWSSITEALDASGWFVLLLSEDAARSEWVGKEIEHWVANKPADRILPVVTDGEFGWENGGVAGLSVPPALLGVFSEEPRWVDLRFAKGDENLDLQNPDFSAAVADISSAIRGVPKDELASEEVRQHRRTVRTAWTAGALVTVLAVASIVAGVFAIGQRNDARDNADLAQANALIAEQNAAEALANAEEASRSAALAEARELAASAINVLDSDPELSILLTLEAIEHSPAGEDQPTEVIDALWQAVQQHRLVEVIDTGHDEGLIGVISLSPDSSTLVLANHGIASVQARSVPDGALLWEHLGDESDRFITVVYSPDGTKVAVGASGDASVESGEREGRVMILNAADGSLELTITYPECTSSDMGAGWSPDGSVFGVSPVLGICHREGTTAGTWAEVLDGETLAPVALIDSPAVVPVDGTVGGAFDESSRLYLFAGIADPVTVHSPPDYGTTRVIEGVVGYGAVSADGSTIVTFNNNSDDGLAAFDTETGAVIDHLTPLPAFPFDLGLTFTGPEGWLVSPSLGEATLVWDISTGQQLFDLHSDTAFTSAISPDGRWMYTGHSGGILRVWDLGLAVGFDRARELDRFSWVNGDSILLGPRLGVFAGLDLETFESRMFFFDPVTGESVGDPLPGHSGGALADGQFLSSALNGVGWWIVDPGTGDRQIIACSPDGETGLCVETGEPPASDLWVLASVDGSELLKLENGGFTFLDPGDLSATAYVSGHSFTWAHAFSDDWVLGETGVDGDKIFEDRTTGEELARVEDGPEFKLAADESTIAIWNGFALHIVDTNTWEQRSLPSDVGRVRGLSIEWALGRFALGDENGLHVFDLDSGELLVEVPMPSVSDAHWLDEDTVLVGTNTGIWARVSLDTDDLVASAAAGVTRGFSATECSTYRIDPCPTLDEIRNR